MTFDKFENVWEISGKITLVSPLRIGTEYPEYSTTSSRTPLLYRYDAGSDAYSLFIPGSSLKGVLRSSVERILRTHEMDLHTTEKLFGGQHAASKVIVRDCLCPNTYITEERLHAAGKVKVETIGSRKVYVLVGRGPPRFYSNEVIPPFSEFDFRIDVYNATDSEIALLLRALEEFKFKRAMIGGGVSRGNGFVSIKDVKIKKTSIDGFSTKTEEVDTTQITQTLKLNESVKKTSDDDFENFLKYAAADSREFEGCVVCELEAMCETDFFMKGEGGEIVTGAGIPVIPGSVIKGFLRHLCYYKNDGRRAMLDWDKEKVDRIFGSQKQRSHILISEAFTIEEIAEDSRVIPSGKKLRCWIVFDNMRRNEIDEILNILKKRNRITGNQSARGPYAQGAAKYNEVRFEIRKAYKYHVGNRTLTLDFNS